MYGNLIQTLIFICKLEQFESYQDQKWYNIYLILRWICHTLEKAILYKISPILQHLSVWPLKPDFLPECNENRFSISWPICSYAELQVIPIASKVMAGCGVTHWTSSHFLVGLHIYLLFFCIMFPSSHQPLEWLVPGVGTIATNNGCRCEKYCYSCSNALLLARTS